MTSRRVLRTACLMFALAAGCADFSRGPAAVVADGGAGEGGTPNPDGAVAFADVEAILIGGQCCGQEFDGHQAVQGGVLSKIDFTHAARSEQGANLVTTQTCVS